MIIVAMLVLFLDRHCAGPTRTFRDNGPRSFVLNSLGVMTVLFLITI